MWTLKKMYKGVKGTTSLPALHATAAAIMFKPIAGNEVSTKIIYEFPSSERPFAAAIIGGLVPMQASFRKAGLPKKYKEVRYQIWIQIDSELEGLPLDEKLQVLCKHAYENLPNNTVKSCARLFAVLSSSPASRNSYLDEIVPLWSPFASSEQDLWEVINSLVTHGMCEMNPAEMCIRVPIPLVKFFRSLVSLEESATIYNRFLSPHATTLHKAALHDYTDLAESILAQNATPQIVDARDRAGWTPLLFAAQNAAYDIMKLLLDKGADVTAVESTNQTALHRACFSGSLPCVKILLEHGAPINHVENTGITPVVVAQGKGHEDVVQYLLEQGAVIPDQFKYLWE